eukprot:COSAG03_NODE_3522_length_1970_cov_3.931587_2_plen_51_part_00
MGGAAGGPAGAGAGAGGGARVFGGGELTGRRQRRYGRRTVPCWAGLVAIW